MKYDPLVFEAFFLPHLLETCDASQDALEKAEASLKVLQAKIQTSIDDAQQEMAEGLSFDDYSQDSHYRGLQDDVNATIRRLAQSLYNISRSLPAADPFHRTVKQVRRDNYHKYAEGIYGIQIFLSKNDKDEEVILCRLPMLQPVVKYFAHAGRHDFPVITSNIYTEEIKDGMEILIDTDPTICKRYGVKTLSFFYVYNTENNMLDTMNHDTKLVIDAITGMLLGGDDASCCSVCYSTVISKFLPEGTYICISQGKRNFAQEEILKRFEDI